MMIKDYNTRQIVNALGEACESSAKQMDDNRKLIEENLYLKGRVDGIELAMRLLGKYSLVGAALDVGAEVSATADAPAPTSAHLSVAEMEDIEQIARDAVDEQ